MCKQIPLNKEFVLVHIKFDPLKLAENKKTPPFLENQCFRPLNAKCALCVLLHCNKRPPFHMFFFLCMCTPINLSPPPPPPRHFHNIYINYMKLYWKSLFSSVFLFFAFPCPMPKLATIKTSQKFNLSTVGYNHATKTFVLASHVCSLNMR